MNITVSNFGGGSVSLRSVWLDGDAVEFVIVSGDSVVDVGESVVLQVFWCFLGGVSYRFGFFAVGGNEVVFVAKAPKSSSTSLVEPESLENVTDDEVEASLGEDKSDGESAGSDSGDSFADAGGVESYSGFPETVVGRVYSGPDPSYYYAQDLQARHHLWDIDARKTLLREYSELEWEPIKSHVNFYVGKVAVIGKPST